MAWFFDPLHAHIKERLPTNAHGGFAIVRSIAEEYFEGRSPNQRTQGVNFVVAVWAANQIAQGKYPVSQKDYEFIRNASNTAWGWLTEDSRQAAEYCVDNLASNGHIKKLV